MYAFSFNRSVASNTQWRFHYGVSHELNYIFFFEGGRGGGVGVCAVSIVTAERREPGLYNICFSFVIDKYHHMCVVCLAGATQSPVRAVNSEKRRRHAVDICRHERGSVIVRIH